MSATAGSLVRRLGDVLRRRRVFLGFLVAGVVLWLAQPTLRSLLAGSAISALGEALRIWAAGHVEKSREVTRSGPYGLTRHPLYLGSSVIGLGIAVASASWTVGGLVLVYLGSTLPAAMRAEESHLRDKFGSEYAAYTARQAPPMRRAFSPSRALANREHHAVLGLLLAWAVLALKASLSLR